MNSNPRTSERGNRREDRRMTPRRWKEGNVNKDNVIEDDGIQDRVIHIGRVAKTVKGGRNIRFTAIVIVGKGKVGKAWVKLLKYLMQFAR